MSAGSSSWRRLHIPWGAKKNGTETESPKVSANLCCPISLTHNYIQKLESPPAIVPATTIAENYTKPKPDEVRWSVHVLQSLWHSGTVWKLTERRSNKKRLRHCHRERGSNPVSICICGHPSSIPARGHWCCTGDYSSMRGSLNSAFEICRTID